MDDRAMTTYVVRRILQLIPVLFVTSFAIFLLLHAVPGDPASIYAGQDATPEQIDAVRRAMGLDRPLLVQFGIWLGAVLSGDLGSSSITGYDVADLLAATLPASLELAVLALLVGIVLGISAGVLAARYRDSIVDWLVTSYSTVALAVPNFWLGILLVLAFSVSLRWFPTSGRVPLLEDPGRALLFLALPTITLGVRISGVLARFTRSSLLEVLPEDFVRTARSKGLGEGYILFHHAFRVALIPIVTVIGAEFGRLVSGVVIVEAIFAWPGVGRLLLQSIGSRDYVVVQSSLLILITIFIVINLIVDLLYVVLNPRIRLS